jgi:hypothetical protein
VGTGAAVALTLGVGLGTAYLGYGGKYGRAIRARRQFGLRAVSENGLLKEAIGGGDAYILVRWKLNYSSSDPFAFAAAPDADGLDGHTAQSRVYSLDRRSKS